MQGLEKTIVMHEEFGIPCEAWIDGSFLTQKIEPDDADIVLMLESDRINAATSQQREFLDECGRNLETIEQDFLCHVHFGIVGVIVPGTKIESKAYWTRQFGVSRRKEVKGIAVIELGAGLL